jgi:hypothetical protein
VGGLRKTRHRGTAGRPAVHPDRRRLQTWSGCPSCWRQADHARTPPRAPRSRTRRRPGTPQNLAEAPFPTSKRGNEAANDLISAAC